MDGSVVAVARSSAHRFSKQLVEQIEIVAGHGVAGDAHHGVTVRHRSRVAVDPSQPNLRQVHVIHAELFDEVASKGFVVGPGQLGENITTAGIDLLSLPRCGSGRMWCSKSRDCGTPVRRSMRSSRGCWPPSSAAVRTTRFSARLA